MTSQPFLVYGGIVLFLMLCAVPVYVFEYRAFRAWQARGFSAGESKRVLVTFYQFLQKRTDHAFNYLS